MRLYHIRLYLHRLIQGKGWVEKKEERGGIGSAYLDKNFPKLTLEKRMKISTFSVFKSLSAE